MILASLAWMLVGCESEEEVAADMERSLRESNTALIGALMSAEVLGHVFDTPDTQLRHVGNLCGCPCTDRIGTTAPFVMTLDYDTAGCVPESGLLPTALSGHATVDFDGEEATVSWDLFEFALEHPVDGDLVGTVEETDDGLAIASKGPVTIGDETITVDLDLRVATDGVTIDGEATVASDDPRPVRFDGVELSFSEIAPPCPAPGVGTATLVNPDQDKKNVVVAFADPGDGFVKVSRDDRVSESADWCAYASELW